MVVGVRAKVRILYETQLLLPEKQSIAVSYDMENQLFFSLIEEGEESGRDFFPTLSIMRGTARPFCGPFVCLWRNSKCF